MPAERTATFKAPKFPLLDFLRLAAALVVVLIHIQDYGGYRMPHQPATLCVLFFFVLSGFVLTHAYEDYVKTGGFGLADFLLVRVARLYPLQLVTFLLLVAFWLLMTLERAIGHPLQAPFRWDWQSIVENLTLTHLLLGTDTVFNSPAWSIGVEFWCGVLLFGLMRWSGVLRVTVLAIVAVLLAIVEGVGGLLSTNDHLIGGIFEKYYIVGAACFAVGWGAYHLRARKARPWTAALVVTVVAVALFSPTTYAVPAIVTEFSFIGAFGLLVALVSGVEITSSRAVGITEASGNMSFAIYLWHMPLLTILSTLLVAGGGRPPLLGTPAFTPIFLTMLFAVSALSFTYLELPAKRWIRHAGMTALAAARSDRAEA